VQGRALSQPAACWARNHSKFLIKRHEEDEKRRTRGVSVQQILQIVRAACALPSFGVPEAGLTPSLHGLLPVRVSVCSGSGRLCKTQRAQLQHLRAHEKPINTIKGGPVWSRTQQSGDFVNSCSCSVRGLQKMSQTDYQPDPRHKAWESAAFWFLSPAPHSERSELCCCLNSEENGEFESNRRLKSDSCKHMNASVPTNIFLYR
jgi:hypothetical protein